MPNFDALKRAILTDVTVEKSDHLADQCGKG